jgi:hypothetical protein
LLFVATLFIGIAIAIAASKQLLGLPCLKITMSQVAVAVLLNKPESTAKNGGSEMRGFQLNTVEA